VYVDAVRVASVLGPGSPLSRAPAAGIAAAHLATGYEEREGQLAMAEAVEAALHDDQPLFVEAGTGTGKTLAYLLPAILSGKKVVVSTATRALQEQITARDLPLCADILAQHGVRFRAAMMKGLGNYLCKRRFEEARVAHGAILARDLAAVERWALATETGDRAELSALAEDSPAWREVVSSTETRIGATCKYFDACFVTRMKREAEAADIVVVNHHLFCADLALRRGRGRGGDYATVLPPYDAVIFDEAHQLEDVATTFFGVRASSARVEALVRDARRAFQAGGIEKGAGGTQARPILELVEEAGYAFFASFPASSEPRRALAPSDFRPDTLARFAKLDGCLEALAAFAEPRTADEAVGLVARRAHDLRRDLREIVRGASHDGDDAPARVAWIEVRERSVSLGASPIDLGPTLREGLFDRVPAVVCTSATLATGTTFHFARRRLGAPPHARELVVDSPFDFQRRALLYLPRDLPDPNQEGFERAAVERIVELVSVTGGGAFVLCTSARAMRALHAALAPRLRQPVLVQGEAPKQLLLDRFRAAGDAVLVATMSFWEGVDVPGHALRLVVIDKIPFAVPTDPVVAARCAEIEREGGNAFSQYTVPVAALTLKQGFGRLLRSQKDAGIVAILDRRIVTRGYGRALLAGLPPARRTAAIDDVRAFFQDVFRAAGLPDAAAAQPLGPPAAPPSAPLFACEGTPPVVRGSAKAKETVDE